MTTVDIVQHEGNGTWSIDRNGVELYVDLHVLTHDVPKAVLTLKLHSVAVNVRSYGGLGRGLVGIDERRWECDYECPSNEHDSMIHSQRMFCVY